MKLLSSILFCIFLLFASLAQGQTYKQIVYPWDCCGEEDCHPVPCDELLEDTTGGYKYKDLYYFSKNQVKNSEDNKCHVCIMGIKPLCAFIQLGF